MKIKKVDVDTIRKAWKNLTAKVDRLTRRRKTDIETIEKLLDEQQKKAASEPAETFLDARGAVFEPGKPTVGWTRTSTTRP
jgi:hypothetical protein